MRAVALRAVALLALSILGAVPAVRAQTPAYTAYQGDVGDWALGTWRGTIHIAPTGGSVSTHKIVVVVEKQATGQIWCKLFDATRVSDARWSPGCSITDQRLKLTTEFKSTLDVSRSGDKLAGILELFIPPALQKFQIQMSR